ncbi:MAG: HDOD domain-containing protein, partial [Chloroflexi bacterium]|nr:HDOD domain-containing protein [Chloroflexota bacterium]
ALDEVLAEVADLRPLPQVAQRILGLDEGKFSAHELASIIATDQALTAKLLRLANSPYYGFARRITTARDAVVLLGFRSVRGAALTSCLMQTASSASNLDYDGFWQFSIATGILAEVLARTEGAHQEEAFTAGVLHQIGLLALDQGRPDELHRAIGLHQQSGVPMPEAERQVLGFTAAELGGALALHWNFPESLSEAVRDHARPLDTLPDPRSLTACVLRARMFVRAYGLPDGIAPAVDPSAIPDEWDRPPLSVALKQSGGMAKVMSQVEALVGSLG